MGSNTGTSSVFIYFYLGLLCPRRLLNHYLLGRLCMHRLAYSQLARSKIRDVMVTRLTCVGKPLAALGGYDSYVGLGTVHKRRSFMTPPVNGTVQTVSLWEMSRSVEYFES